MWKDVAVGAVSAILAVAILGVAQGIWGWAEDIFGPADPIPSGAVVAFDTECPKDGWEPYKRGAGRFILGADKIREIHDKGGAAEHKLTIAEMPEHNHHKGDGKRYVVQMTGKDTTTRTDQTSGEIDIVQGFELVDEGKGQPHNNMPPYLVLNFCRKK